MFDDHPFDCVGLFKALSIDFVIKNLGQINEMIKHYIFKIFLMNYLTLRRYN